MQHLWKVGSEKKFTDPQKYSSLPYFFEAKSELRSLWHQCFQREIERTQNDPLKRGQVQENTMQHLWKVGPDKRFKKAPKDSLR